MEIKAKSTSWKCIPFEEGVPIPVDVEGTTEDLEKVKLGFIPAQMEDKWFIYFQSPYLYLHRSWTGRPVYRIEIEGDEARFWVKESLISRDLAEGEDLQYQGLLARFLVSNILLQRGVDFPMPPDVVEKRKGVYQHHIAGTGYREARTGSSKKRWWQFWRKL